MTQIIYTRILDSEGLDNSSLVDEAYYNENTSDLFIDLGDVVYKYSNVPVSVVDDFESADSAGSFYSTQIKGKFGPSENLGSWINIAYDKAEVEQKIKADSISTATVGANPSNVIVGGAISSTVSPSAYSLKPFADATAKIEGHERDYAVVFTVSGLAGTKTHKLKSTSVDEAVNSVLDLGKMLELTFIPTQVIITL